MPRDVRAAKIARAHRRTRRRRHDSPRLALDLGSFAAIELDPKNRTVRVGPGVRSGALAAALAPHGLAFPVGHCADVALGGYLLNGGLGWNRGEWGPACDSVRGIEIVNAAGEVVHADDKNNTDLFWAARGAGPGFFGVVTRYDLAVHDLPRAIHFYTAAFALDALPALAEWLPQAIAGVHPHVEVICGIGTDPQGRPVVTLLGFGFADSAAEARSRVAALAERPSGIAPLGDAVDQPTTLPELFAAIGGGSPGTRMHADGMMTNAGFGELLRAVGALVATVPPAPSAISFVTLGGSTPPPRSGNGAYSPAGSAALGAFAFWESPADDARYVAWTRDVIRAAEPLASGHYVGETDLAAPPDRASKCFAPDAWRRLGELKRKLDPDDLFYSYAI